jgi:hypothetical protein
MTDISNKTLFAFILLVFFVSLISLLSSSNILLKEVTGFAPIEENQEKITTESNNTQSSTGVENSNIETNVNNSAFNVTENP